MPIDNYTNSEYAGLGGRVLAREGGVPTPGGTITLSTSTVNASTALAPGHYRLIAETTGAFVRLGVGSATAVLDVDMFVPPNVPLTIFVGFNDSNQQYTHLGAILRAGTGRLYISPLKA